MKSEFRKKILNFIKQNSKKIKNDESVIDLGAGELRYKRYFSHCNYKSQDLGVGDEDWYFNDIDIKSPIYDVPVEDNSFDYIVCTQVLEHLEYPDKAFLEFYRILKPGGKVLLTAPLGQGEHQVPYDFFRYTQYGLKSLGERSGLKLTYIDPHGGIFINLEYILWRAIHQLLPFQQNPLFKYFTLFITLPFKFISGVISVILDILDTKKIYTLNYNCIYEKK